MTEQIHGAALGGPNRPAWWRAWLMLFLPPFSLLLVTAAFAAVAVGMADGDRSVIRPAIGASITYIIAVNHIFLFLLMLAFMRLDRLSFGDMGWRLRPPVTASLGREALIGLAAGTVIYVIHQYGLTAGVAALFEALGIPSLRAASGAAPLGQNLVPALAAGIVLGGFIEEHIYRGYVLVRLTERMPAWLALIPLTIGFALLHFGLGLTGMTVAAGTGLLLSLLFLWRRSLPAAIIAHAAVNTLVLLL